MRNGTNRGSGGTRSSGAPRARVGAVFPGGVIVSVPPPATMLLAACCVRLDADGTICSTVRELASSCGASLRTTHRSMATLVGAGLVHTSGKTRRLFRYVDAKLLKALQVPVTRRTHDDGWREMRARCGGLERALRAAQVRAANANRQAEQHAAARQAHPEVDGVDAAWLRRELQHSSDCLDPDCDRCLEVSRFLEDDDADIKAEILEQLDEAATLKLAARLVVEASRDRGVGSRSQCAHALAELERLVM